MDNHSITNIWANMILNIVAMEEASALIESTVQALKAVRPSNELIQSISSWETPVFPLGIAALRRRNPGEKMVEGSIPLKGHFWELLNRLLNFWYWSDEFEKQTRTRKVTSTVRSYPYPVHRTSTDDPIYGGGNGPRWR